MSNITLSAGVRQNLLSLQSTADMMASTQNRLATGKRVNSAIDNPTNFFTAQTLNGRASELSNLMDSMSNSIKTIEAADNGIKAITKLVESAQSTARQALQNAESQTTMIEGAGLITPSGTGGTSKAQAENQSLSAIGFDTGDTLTVTTSKDGVDQTFTFTMGTTTNADGSPVSTVKDLVGAINASGVASASVTDNGKFKLTTTSDKELSVSVSSADASDSSTEVDAAAGLGLTNITAGDVTRTFTDGAAAGDADVLTLASTAAGSSVNNDKLVAQFNDILSEIDKLAGDADYNGINLLKSGNTLKIAFNEKTGTAKSEMTLNGIDTTSSGLDLTAATSLDATEAESRLEKLSGALRTLRETSSSLGSNLSTVQARKDFTNNMINTLETGADNLVLADTNKEAANLLALQTRQQLSSTALSMASQADQAVLRLF
ncbi:flagellin N-terminal helical domain-containing protein [Pelagibacterium lacus]|uniref:Flagellin n=1 Tax=Pelagibacterium lacus TaxID=2282655 RepID=A0A369WA58_9HYPH|nr:flagellin [Pelagibacterium lacus]RDE10250.1 flagellin [Pelagibacterium lacus]